MVCLLLLLFVHLFFFSLVIWASVLQLWHCLRWKSWTWAVLLSKKGLVANCQSLFVFAYFFIYTFDINFGWLWCLVTCADFRLLSACQDGAAAVVALIVLPISISSSIVSKIIDIDGQIDWYELMKSAFTNVLLSLSLYRHVVLWGTEALLLVQLHILQPLDLFKTHFQLLRRMTLRIIWWRLFLNFSGVVSLQTIIIISIFLSPFVDLVGMLDSFKLFFVLKPCHRVHFVQLWFAIIVLLEGIVATFCVELALLLS